MNIRDEPLRMLITSLAWRFPLARYTDKSFQEFYTCINSCKWLRATYTSRVFLASNLEAAPAIETPLISHSKIMISKKTRIAIKRVLWVFIPAVLVFALGVAALDFYFIHRMTH